MIFAVFMAAFPAPLDPTRGAAFHLAVPIVRQAPERCGAAALGMVVRYYRGDSAALAACERAYDPVLRGVLVTDLAAAARAAGFDASVEKPDEDSLVALLGRGVPPVLLFQDGVGPVTRAHYGVLVGWDRARARYLLNDGRPRERPIARDQLMRRWRAAGGLALVVRHARP